MGAESAPAAVVDPSQRHRAGLVYRNPLAGNPAGAPRWSATVKRADGSTLAIACPTATRLLVALMDMNAVIGGAACHWGGPAAFAEAMSAIHGLMFARPGVWHEHFNFANDAGHAENGIYALKANYGFAGVTVESLKGFRSIASKLTGHGESHLFADGVMISNGPLGSSLPVTQGLAMADRLANRKRTTICAISDGAMMEGEAKEAVTAIPGLAAKDLLNPFVLVLSDNNTKLSGRIDGDAYSMQGYFASLEAQGWRVVRCEQGNDLQATFSAIEAAVALAEGDRTKPVCVWLKTVKGYSVASTVKSSSGGHGYPLAGKDAAEGKLRAFLAEIAGGKALAPEMEAWLSELEAQQKAKLAKAAAPAPAAPAVKKDKIQAGFSKAMIAAADKGLPVVSVTSDLPGSTGVAGFRQKYPQLSFDVGIAESNMVSTAAGFSKQGYIPVVDTFAQFGVTKGALPHCMANLSQSPVIAVYTHTGFQDAADGASHQGLMYLAMVGAIPHTRVHCPASAEEAEWAMAWAIQHFADARAKGEQPDTIIFFCGRENFPISLKVPGAAYAWGAAQVVADSTAGTTRKVAISASGSMVVHAMKAAEKLAAQGIGALVLNNATPNRPDVAAHKAALAACGGKLVTVDDHQAVGGAGSMLLAALADAQVLPSAIRLLGVHGEFGQSAYTADELYAKHGIDAVGIAKAAAAIA